MAERSLDTIESSMDTIFSSEEFGWTSTAYMLGINVPCKSSVVMGTMLNLLVQKYTLYSHIYNLMVSKEFKV